MRIPILVLLLLWSQGVCLGQAQQTDSPPTDANSSAKSDESSADLDAIREASEVFVAAFNKQDAKAIATLWTDDGEYIDDMGHRVAGREAIQQAYAELFATNPGLVMKIAIDSLRTLSPNTAVEEGRAVVEAGPAGVAGVTSYVVVHTKTEGKWLMASVRDKRIDAPASVRSAADLQWLIGNWKAEEHGVQTESVFRWVADGRFIERRYTTTLFDGTKTTGVQLIGWNPQGGHVQSWDFSPDGGHAIGLWIPAEGGWQAKVVGTTGDGISTSAVNWLIRLDDNAYVWKSAQRFLGDEALPDTGEVIIKRQKAQ
jgi:uncharacterized protein (TIGR02246 family)